MTDTKPKPTLTPERLRARYYGRMEHGYGNVVWSKRGQPGFRYVRFNRFGPKHPCRDNPHPTVFSRNGQPDSDDPLGQLRARGYLASCFPEGDGLSFDPPPGKPTAEIVRDFEECLGLAITVERE